MSRKKPEIVTYPVYVIARNASGRPTLQHKLMPGAASLTACGTPIESWSRAYQSEPIHEVLCKREACQAGSK